jgi:tRNA(Leu) C34 or U34 (ribose-2'-O)-methylase TrmL
VQPFDSLVLKMVAFTDLEGRSLRPLTNRDSPSCLCGFNCFLVSLVQNLLTFLRSHRATSSSVSLDGFHFPDQPILLLLGKEKEGIPVAFLQAVDQCVEIPQMGITRSLNVHVSGAIAIWEHTKQRMGGIQ